MKETADQLRNLALRSEFENTKYFFLKTPVKVGTNPNGDVYCNYFYWHTNSCYGDDYIVIHVLFDEKEDDLYSRKFNFTLIAYENEETWIPNIIDNEKNLNLTIFPDALATILQAAIECGDEWLEYQKNLQIRSRHFQRRAANVKNISELTWEEQIERQRNHIERDWLSNWRTYDGDQKTLDEMLTLGEVAYKKKVEEFNERIKPLMKEIMDELLADPENDWLKD